MDQPRAWYDNQCNHHNLLCFDLSNIEIYIKSLFFSSSAVTEDTEERYYHYLIHCIIYKFYAYLVFVISFSPAKLFKSYYLHPKITKNTKKLQQIAPKSAKYAIFCIQSRNIYTGQNLFTQAPPVVAVTNMRYVL